MLERAAIICEGGLITGEHLTFISSRAIETESIARGTAQVTPSAGADTSDLRVLERAAIERALRDELADSMSEQDQHYNALGELRDFAGMLGQRLGEMHQMLAASTDNADFAPQVSSAKDMQATGKDVAAQVEHALKLLKQHQGELSAADQKLVARLLDEKKTILAHVQDQAKKAVVVAYSCPR